MTNNFRKSISQQIRVILKSNGSSKQNRSIVNYLPCKIEEIITHIEKQFLEPGNEWMNWKNWGMYNKETWDDNDSSTFCWNLDHIIPQSDLPYTSMEDENFKKCWALENLRPLSAKQNIIEGANRSRHNKKR